MANNEDFTKFRWICTFIGLLCFLADMGSDFLVGVQYFNEGKCIWFALTISFIIIASLCMQIFSYAWFKDDEKERNRTHDTGHTNLPDQPHLFLVHLLQMGFLTRQIQLLKSSYKSVWYKKHRQNQNSLEIFGLAADLSMLRLFETFLESIPQLILQLYIVLQHQHASIIQYTSMVVSFMNIAWTTVDYWHCLRRSLPDKNNMHRGLPFVVYLLYKVLTISTRILSLTLLLMLSIYSTLDLFFIWLLGTVWAHAVKTEFCTSVCLEELYRGIIGFILIFTFFNVKGDNTKVEMTVYYIFNTLLNLLSPIFLFLLKPRTMEAKFFLPIMTFVIVSNALGLMCLVLYYSTFHPKNVRKQDVVDEPYCTENIHMPDEVDGSCRTENILVQNEVDRLSRIKQFIRI